MLESPRSKEIISYRRQVRTLERDGYKIVPMHWHGPDYNQMIADAKVVDGRAVFVKIVPRPHPQQQEMK